MMRTLILGTLIFITNTVYSQQIPQRSDFKEAGLIWNPAMTAPWEYIELGTIYRQQWVGFKDAPTTANIYFQVPLIYHRMSFGAGLLNDKIGPLNKTKFFISYAYKFNLGIKSKDQLAIGVQASFDKLKLNPSKSVVNNLDDPFLAFNGASNSHTNFGAGFFYTSTSSTDYEETYFYLGAAVNQLLANGLRNNNETLLQEQVHANAVIGTKILKGLSYIEPSIWFNYLPFQSLLITGNLRYELEDVFWLGFDYSTNSTLGIQLGYILKNRFLQDGLLKIGVRSSYSFNSKTTIHGLGYEGFVAYRFEL